MSVSGRRLARLDPLEDEGDRDGQRRDDRQQGEDIEVAPHLGLPLHEAVDHGQRPAPKVGLFARGEKGVMDSTSRAW